MTEYSEKELAIFRGVFKLAREGRPMGEITSKQIAAAAGMGKATIYDYFSSKEEIILKALSYAAAKQNRLVNEKLAELQGFKPKIMCIFNEIINTVENSISVFNLISYLGSRGGKGEELCNRDNARLVEEVIGKTKNTIRAIIQAGVEEGVIAPHPQDYVAMTLQAVIFTVGKTRTMKNLPPRTICHNAYTMLVKALG